MKGSVCIRLSKHFKDLSTFGGKHLVKVKMMGTKSIYNRRFSKGFIDTIFKRFMTNVSKTLQMNITMSQKYFGIA